jgi:hypothetical protein
MSASLALATAALIALLCVPACSGNDDTADGAEPDEPTTELGPACALLDADQVAEATGEEVELVAGLSSGPQCVLQVGEGPAGVTVALVETPSRAQFDALVTADAAPTVPNEGEGVVGADQSLIWSEGFQLKVGLARVGGSAVRISWVQSVPDQDEAPMVRMLGAAVGKLPDADFEDGVAPGQATCDRVPLDQVRAALELPNLEAAPVGAAAACGLSDGSGVNLIVELPEGEATPEQATSSGRVTTIDGEDYEWTPEAVSGLGSAAVWTEDPVSERSGELVAVFDGRLVRISSSANDPGPEIKERAIAAARVVGGATG